MELKDNEYSFFVTKFNGSRSFSSFIPKRGKTTPKRLSKHGVLQY